MQFYDHAKNHNPAQATAIARARREAIKAGEAYKIVFQIRPDSEMFYWTGCRYDVLGLAKSLVFNDYHLVEVVRNDNIPMTIAQIKEARY